jgi:hypothetical protein
MFAATSRSSWTRRARVERCTLRAIDALEGTPRVLLQDNCFGATEWVSIFGASFDQEQLLKIGEFPWTTILTDPCPFEPRKLIKDTHFGFMGVTVLDGKHLSIAEWHRILRPFRQPKLFFDGKPWYVRHTFGRETTCQLRWYLMYKGAIPGSETEEYDTQVAMLPSDYEIPTAAEEVTKALLFYYKTGVYLNSDLFVRCLDTTDKGLSVMVGFFDPLGLLVMDEAEELSSYSCHQDVGIGASRKLPHRDK